MIGNIPIEDVPASEPPKDPEQKEEKPKKRRKPRGLDAEQEAEDFVYMVDEAQALVSEKLRFSEKERTFHKGTIKAIVNHYKISIMEYIVGIRVVVSALMILRTWAISGIRWYRERTGPEEVGDE